LQAQFQLTIATTIKLISWNIHQLISIWIDIAPHSTKKHFFAKTSEGNKLLKKRGNIKKIKKQAGAELGQAQIQLELVLTLIMI